MSADSKKIYAMMLDIDGTAWSAVTSLVRDTNKSTGPLNEQLADIHGVMVLWAEAHKAVQTCLTTLDNIMDTMTGQTK